MIQSFVECQPILLAAASGEVKVTREIESTRILDLPSRPLRPHAEFHQLLANAIYVRYINLSLRVFQYQFGASIARLGMWKLDFRSAKGNRYLAGARCKSVGQFHRMG